MFIYIYMTGKLRCPECNSTQTRYRLRTKDYQCHVCGYSWKQESEDEE